MYAFIAGNHEYCVTLQTARAHPCGTGQHAKVCKRRSFALQYAAFWSVKGGLLRRNIRSFGKSVATC